MNGKKKKRFEFWKRSSEEEIKAASVLLKKKGEHPPITHNLKYLAEQIELKLSEDRQRCGYCGYLAPLWEKQAL